MKRSRLALLAGVLWLFLGGMAAAQPTPITSCYTTITQSGSYVLTHDLNCVPTSGDGITIATTATHVTLDLGGFALTANAQNRFGIDDLGLYTVVSNGTINGWGYGVGGGNYLLALRNVTISSSAHSGADVGPLGVLQVTRSRFLKNAGAGVSAGNGGVFLVDDSSFFSNFGGGFFYQSNSSSSILSNDLAWSNDGGGFSSGSGSGPAIYLGNMAAEGDNFFPVCPGSVMADNVAGSASSFPSNCTLRDNIP